MRKCIFSEEKTMLRLKDGSEAEYDIYDINPKQMKLKITKSLERDVVVRLNKYRIMVGKAWIFKLFNLIISF